MKMGIKRIIDTDFWKDEKVLDNYSPEDKYFWLYLLTNPQTRQLGVYKLPKKIIAFETGYSLDTINVLLERFQNKYEVIVYSGETQEVAILNYLKYSIIKGGKPVIDCIAKDISMVKDVSLLGVVSDKLYRFTDGRETMDEIKKMLSSYSKDFNDNDIHNDNDNDSIVGVSPTNRGRIVQKQKSIPPTTEEVRDYCLERNNKIDPQRFIDHYETNGWMRGKNKIKSWKACIRTWEARNNEQPQTKSSNPFRDLMKEEGLID